MNARAMLGEDALRERAARALDLTHSVGERGPRTMRARALVAAWLDAEPYRRRPRGLAEALRWLEALAADAERNPDPGKAQGPAPSPDGAATS